MLYRMYLEPLPQRVERQLRRFVRPIEYRTIDDLLDKRQCSILMHVHADIAGQSVRDFEDDHVPPRDAPIGWSQKRAHLGGTRLDFCNVFPVRAKLFFAYWSRKDADEDQGLGWVVAAV